MQHDHTEIKPYEAKYREQIILVWERSVKATHHFVTPGDIDLFKGMVQQIDFTAFPVYCLVEGGCVLGFLGLADGQIEMLFLDAGAIGRGLGTKLIRFALDELKANKVDVNEQNLSAVRFYRKFGFKVYTRNEKDDHGKDYPILKMKLADGYN